MNQTLTFNLAAAGIINGLSRLRLNKKTRGGVDYAALRPSHRVKGTNPMLKVEKIEGTETLQAELTPELHAMVEGLPALKNQTTYLMFDIGYGWWTLKNFEGDAATSTEPLVTVTRATKSKAKTVPVTDAAPATPAEAIVEATADAALEIAGGTDTPADTPAEPVADAPADDNTITHESAVRSMESVAQMRGVEPTATAETTTAETAAPAVAVESVTADNEEVAKFGEALSKGLATGLTAEDLGIAPEATAKTDDDAANTTPAEGASANSATEQDDDGIITHVIRA